MKLDGFMSGEMQGRKLGGLSSHETLLVFFVIHEGEPCHPWPGIRRPFRVVTPIQLCGSASFNPWE